MFCHMPLRGDLLTPGVFLALIGATFAGCSGDVGFADEVGRCETPNAAPAAPAIVSPRAGFKGVLADGLAISASPFADTDPGDLHSASQFEIWTVSGDTLVTRVWRAERSGAKVVASLTDGSFEPGFTGLSAWSDYAVRARYLDQHGSCGSWSEWSAPAPFRTDDGSAAVFDPTSVREIQIELPQSSIDGMNQTAIPPDCVPWTRPYFPGSVTIDGQRYDHVGLKIKGGCGSARDFNGKPGLKINLEWDDPSIAACPQSRRHLGLKSLTLNNQVQDPSYLHERLAYTLLERMGAPASRAAHVRVTINGTYYGVYLNLETEDRRYLARRFQSEDGMLYEGTYWCDLVPQNLPAGNADDACLTREFSPDVCTSPDPGADPMTYDLLRDLIAKIQALPQNGFYPEVTRFFDYDAFLSMWAVESVIGHWDNYAFEINNNYRVYHDPATGKWSMLAHGLDQTFAKDQDPWAAQGVLAARCLAEKDCEAVYVAKMRQVVALLGELDLAAQANFIYGQIKPHVMADPRADQGAFNGGRSELLQFLTNRPARMQQYFKDHGY
jgi:hypothetical protein